MCACACACACARVYVSGVVSVVSLDRARPEGVVRVDDREQAHRQRNGKVHAGRVHVRCGLQRNHDYNGGSTPLLAVCVLPHDRSATSAACNLVKCTLNTAVLIVRTVSALLHPLFMLDSRRVLRPAPSASASGAESRTHLKPRDWRHVV